MRFELATERLLLRDYNKGDLEDFAAMSSDSEFQRFYSEKDCSPEHWKKLLAMFISEANEQPRTNYNLAICLKSDHKLIGSVGIRLEDNRQASVGCSLNRTFQQQGIAQEAMQSILNFGFQELNAHRIYAETISENRAAIALCEKLGFRKEAEFIEHRYFRNRWWNTSILALLSSEYLYNQPSDDL
ncbi:GNAT family N-acetyltransferase [Endozoicomonas arenosclerae]|uniref:GNAT family N-acetyltransferase n=1 Tax=Endozoicomonas arenosclerae TaxID=1633495 RepID=UPI000781804B|nr:GNAT family protein [Endozoicomonas arenosclerae]